MTELSVSLLLADRDGLQTRFWPVYRLFVAWSHREGVTRVFGPFNMN
mgnify:FL=1